MAFNFQLENDAFVTTVETLVTTTSRKRPQRLLELSCNHIAFLGSAKDGNFSIGSTERLTFRMNKTFKTWDKPK